jgi:hypothetical protein
MTSVLLSGRRDGTTHREVELLGSLPDELVLIGGLAVMCRVGSPHRTTVDLDAVARGLTGIHEDIARLALIAPGSGKYRFSGKLDLDVIDVAPGPAGVLADELVSDSLGGQVASVTDLELNIVALTWAHDHPSRLDVVAIDEEDGGRLAEARDRPVASTAGLVATKAGVIPLRASTRPEKRASDLYDLARLLLVNSDTRVSLADMPPLLADAVSARLHEWFVTDAGRDRTYRDIRRFDEPTVDLDDVSDAVEALLG